MSSASIDEILHFWFEELSRKDWFRKDEALDSTIASRFGAIYHELRDGVPAAWLDTPEGVLAAILVLDQFPRNMFRGDAKTYASDALAREVAHRAIERGVDVRIDPVLREFLYLPFNHSEHLSDQLRCIELSRAAGNAENLKWAEHHADIIRRFGRFPHRNRLLGRATTPEEQAYLDEGGFAP